MAFRRMTRSSSKSHPEQQQLLQTSFQSTTTRNKNKKSQSIQQMDSQEMDFPLAMDQQLEAALNPGHDFVPACFQSQPRSCTSSQLSQNGLSFEPDLLLVCDSNPADDDWKFRSDNSQPGTQLDMVNGIDQVMGYPSALYSPPSPGTSAASVPSPGLTTADHLLKLYLPSPPPEYGDSDPHIPDDDLLSDLDSILSSYKADGQSDDAMSNFRPENNTSFELNLCPDHETNMLDETFLSFADDEEVDAEVLAPTAGPSRRGKTVDAKPASKRGRKRKVSSDSDSSEARKKRQNAEAAKNYRKRRAQLMDKVFKEKEEVEKELDKARKKLQGKLNERNILLKMLYEAHKENGTSSPHKILFPAWIETWYQKQQDD